MPAKTRSAKRREIIARVGAQSVKDLANRVSVDMYKDAYDAGMGLSAWMDQLVQVDKSDRDRGLDAFSLVLQERGIFTRTIPEAGIWADTWNDAFTENECDRLLGLEWATRRWRATKTAMPPRGNDRDIYLSTDYPVGTPFRPYMDAAGGFRGTGVIASAIPLSAVVAITTPIDGIDYRAVYLSLQSADDLRMTRVAESTEPPRKARLTISTHVIPLYKYGMALDASYEVLRRQRLDRIAIELAMLSVQAEVDKLATIMDVMVNGDGNSGTSATTYNLTAMDPTASTSSPAPPMNVTTRGWINYKAQFINPYQITTALVQTPTAVALQLLNLGSANIPLQYIAAQAGFGGFTPINPGLADNVALGWTPSALANKVIGFDARRAIERVVEVGADITEVERHALNQTQTLVMTEVEGYAVLDPLAVRILDLTQ
jgi:hypothetical protein